MNYKMSVLFYGKAAKKTKDNLVPTYLRITIDGQRIEQTTQRYTAPVKWSSDTGRVKGSSAEARQINDHLELLKSRVYDCERQMIQDGENISYESFKRKWLGETEKAIMLLEVFKHHNEQMKQLVGKDFAEGTLERYETSLSHTRSFIEWKFKTIDIDIKNLNYEFVADYEFWLKSEKSCSHNTSMKYISNFRKIVNICIRKGWLVKDPFLGFKMTKREVDRGFLTAQELQAIAAKTYATDRLNLVKNIFIFSCLTGLAYADVKKLKRSEIGEGVDGELWIFTKRQKTDSASRIPILPTAAAILDLYKEHQECIAKDRLLPILSNQKMNAYLKEIADLSSINKNLTFHIARHTFATTVTLSNGVPIESVSKMLGHKNIKTTQHYAKILDKKVSDDMQQLRKKFGSL